MTRKIYSIKNELIEKSREAILAAVEIYNNPNIKFKSENFVMLVIVAWTYLMHAYYRTNKIDYRYYTLKGSRKSYDKTKYGAYKRWELERCINCDECPLDAPVKENLRFLIGLRHEVEHQMTSKIDDIVSAKFQACCLNYNTSISQLFGNQFNISQYLSISLQFSSISEPQMKLLTDAKDLPSNIASYIEKFDNGLSNEIYEDSRYSYRVLFVPKSVNRKGQADKVVEFISPDSQASKDINMVLIKEREKKKLLPKEIVSIMKQEGYSRFNLYHFAQCWKSKNAKKDNTYGAQVANDKWYWYENFVPIVREYCAANDLT